uniref:Uncharacterized protein n=1 Tax=Aegilops tauschii subsp. strangulata TaxID=200361 RepID=A0A453GYV1_AEGTS
RPGARLRGRGQAPGPGFFIVGEAAESAAGAERGDRVRVPGRRRAAVYAPRPRQIQQVDRPTDG